ncbi:MAG TPA: vitamin K epoxide reductase family protein [Phycisphaeraceae bacterium]
MTQHDPSWQSQAHPGATRAGWAVGGIRVLALLGLAGSAFLLYEALGQGKLPGCGAESACDAVLGSQWSQWLGVPVAAPAVVVYAVMLAAAMHAGPASPWRRRKVAWRVLLAGAATTMTAAGWFILVQAVILQAMCKYCLAVHTCGVALSAVVWASAPVQAGTSQPAEESDALIYPRSAAGWGLIGLLPVAMLIAGQLIWPASSASVERLDPASDTAAADDATAPAVQVQDFDTGPGPERRVSMLNGRLQFSPHQLPVIGSPDAPALVLVMFDYTCPYCRQVHVMLEELRERHSGRLGIIALAVPLDARCNPMVRETSATHQGACELAKLALAVWRTDPAAFEAYDAWLFEGHDPPSPQAARAQAVRLVGEAALEQALADPWITEHLARNIELYRITFQTLPQVIAGSTLIRGLPSRDELVRILESELPLEAPAPAEP